MSDWREPYRSMDAGGSDTAAENVGWRWIEDISRQMKLLYGPDDLLIESPALPGDGRVIALYLATKPIAVATIFRDQMNFAILIRWKAANGSLPPAGGTICSCCERTWADFNRTTTCGRGGCPWGGDI